MVFTHAIAGVFEYVKGGWGRKVTFRLGPATPLVAFLLLSRSGAPAMPSRGGSNGGVVCGCQGLPFLSWKVVARSKTWKGTNCYPD